MNLQIGPDVNSAELIDGYVAIPGTTNPNYLPGTSSKIQTIQLGNTLGQTMVGRTDSGYLVYCGPEFGLEPLETGVDAALLHVLEAEQSIDDPTQVRHTEKFRLTSLAVEPGSDVTLSTVQESVEIPLISGEPRTITIGRWIAGLSGQEGFYPERTEVLPIEEMDWQSAKESEIDLVAESIRKAIAFKKKNRDTLAEE